MNYILPIVLVVISNVLYNIIAKSTPGGANPFASLIITYLTAAAATFTLLLTDSISKGTALTAQFKSINWTAFALGVAIIGLEFGYIQAYRAGWNISIGSLVANICLAVLLLAVGFLIYKEHISVGQVAGAVLCVCGLILISKK